MEQQLRLLLESTDNVLSLLQHRSHRTVSDGVSDIYDGTIYRNLNGGVLSDEQNLTVTLNTDGSPVFKSSKTTMWPIQIMLNEFPPNERFHLKNIMVAGIWFGRKEPKMILFLTPFIQELEKLQTDGFKWKTNCNQAI
ncbi:hypothetical protein JTE90_025530 [Oedothorax gibbosus]|uniref:Uncharacterized protein n=1 Tax=Oedothorax gibbosus TaxID=931172 RepID=A0AAV6TX72_9ARAC|nr:hypothetical protein JTE90_025530 [Oedothorax gibbosus]